MTRGAFAVAVRAFASALGGAVCGTWTGGAADGGRFVFNVFDHFGGG